MAKDRIGKLERWILIHAYRKTILKDLPEDWKYHPDRKNIIRNIEFWKGQDPTERDYFGRGSDYRIRALKDRMEEQNTFLNQYEIKANFFDLPHTQRRYTENSSYEDTKYFTGAASARASISRAHKRLNEKGLIEKEWYFFRLTSAGRIKAKTLLLTVIVKGGSVNIKN